MNYYKRHLGDYAKDTGWLTTYQHGVYALLLDWYYASQKPIPLDLTYRIVKARSGPERKAVDEVVAAFFDVTKCAGFAHSKRADLDIAKYQSKSEANSMIALERESTKRARNVVGSCKSGEPSHKPLATSHKEQEQKQEQGAVAPPIRKKSAKLPEQTFADWADSLDGDAIPPTDPVFAYAGKAGLPGDYVPLAWAWFEAEYGDGGPRQTKRYADWRAVFRKAVAGNWGKLWAVNRQGEFFLTTEGVQAQRALA